MIHVRRIDPDRVDVIVRDERRIRFERAPRIETDVQADAAEVESVRRARIDADLAVVVRPRIRRAHEAPRLSAVVCAIEAGSSSAAGATTTTASSTGGIIFLHGSTTAATGDFDERVREVRVLAPDVEPDASHRCRRQSVADARPGFTRVARSPDAAARAGAHHAARAAAPLIRRGEHDARIGRGHHQVVRARFVVDAEHMLPRAAAVGGLVHAAIAASTEERSGRRHEHDVVVVRVDDDAVDRARIRQPHMLERRAAVSRFVHAAAERTRLPVVRLAGAEPDEIRIALRHGHVADGNQAFVLELRLVDRAVARRLPQSAVRCRDVVDRGIRLVHGEIRDAPRHGGGSDRPEVESLELLRDRNRRVLRGKRVGGGGGRGEHRDNRGGEDVRAIRHGILRWDRKDFAGAANIVLCPGGGEFTASPPGAKYAETSGAVFFWLMTSLFGTIAGV